jgi:hypothetical protein
MRTLSFITRTDSVRARYSAILSGTTPSSFRKTCLFPPLSIWSRSEGVTVMRFFIGRILELPLTTTEDYSILHILGDHSIDCGCVSSNSSPKIMDWLVLAYTRIT